MWPLSRAAVIIASYFASSLAAAAAFLACVGGMDWWTRPDAKIDFVFNPDFIIIIIVAALIVALVAALPAVLAIFYAESAAKRNMRFFVGVGTLAAVAPTAPYLTVSMFAGGRVLPAAAWLGKFAVAGMVAGIVYWAIAGRSAGNWHRTAPAASSMPGEDATS